MNEKEMSADLDSEKYSAAEMAVKMMRGSGAMGSPLGMLGCACVCGLLAIANAIKEAKG